MYLPIPCPNQYRRTGYAFSCVLPIPHLYHTPSLGAHVPVGDQTRIVLKQKDEYCEHISYLLGRILPAILPPDSPIADGTF